MATAVAQADAIKTALRDGSASVSTTTTLAALLSPESLTSVSESRAPVKAPVKTSKARNAKAASRVTAKKAGVAIHEDAPTVLSPRAKYALATEVVNISLKVLSEVPKTQTRPNRPSPASRKQPLSPTTPQVRTRRPSEPIQPLHVRSGNANSSPSTPVKVSGLQKPASGLSAATTATAECARLGFAHLRSVDTHGLGVKDTPKSQLEVGTLALVARLIAIGLVTLAIKELRIVKRRLQGVPPRPTKAAASDDVEKETLASLLRLQPLPDSKDLLALAVTYQQLVMKVILASGKPAVVQDALQYLLLDSDSAPANVVMRLGFSSGDATRTARQLEALAQALLSVCPSMSAAQDSAAINGTHSPSPTTVFAFQVLALQIRQKWWKLAGHEVDYGRELAEPFSKCLATFARRTVIVGLELEAYEHAQKAFVALGLESPLCPKDVGFQLFRTLEQLAVVAKHQDALHWATQMVHACEDLECNNARSIASLVRLATFSVEAESDVVNLADIDKRLVDIADRLKGQLSGHTADYDFLMAALAQLLQHISSANLITKLLSAGVLAHLAASFAQRYGRSYSGRNITQTQAILHSALRCSKDSKDLHKWITTDAASIYIQCGALRAVVEAATQDPLLVAWDVGPRSIALGRVLKALLLKAVTIENDSATCTAYDDESLQEIERAVLLEWQLMYAISLADSPNHRASLRMPIRNMLSKLSVLLTVAKHPLRRARVTTAATRLCEAHPDVLSPATMEAWKEDSQFDGKLLADDVGLRPFADDVSAGSNVARAFHTGRPTAASLKPALVIWQKILDGSASVEMLRRQVDSVNVLSLQLRSIAAYFGMLGDASARLPVLRLLHQLSRVAESSNDEQAIVCMTLAQQYLELGFSEKAGHILAEGRKRVSRPGVSHLTKLQFTLTYADYALAIDNIESARQTLGEAAAMRVEMPHEKVARSDRTAYELAHAHAWSIHSKLSLAGGIPRDALAGAKTAVRVLNTAWLGIERSTGSKTSTAVADSTSIPEPKDLDAVAGLAAGVSKLQLKPIDSALSTDDGRSDRGAAFWDIVPIMCRTLLHLSDMYVHHGLYAEADYYSTRAVSMAESTDSVFLLSRIRCHRSRFLALSGRLEDAELCLSKVDEGTVNGISIAQVELCCAKAAIRASEGSWVEALELHRQAVSVVESMQSHEFIANVDCLVPDTSKRSAEEEDPSTNVRKEVRDRVQRKPAATTRTSVKGPRPGPASRKTPAAQAARGSKTPIPKEDSTDSPASGCYLLNKLKTKIILEESLIALRSGNDIEAKLAQFGPSKSETASTLCQQRLRAQYLMRKAVTALQSDISYNMLSESTLSFPAIARTGARSSVETALVPSPLQVPSITVTLAKGSTRKKPVSEDAVGLLQEARDCLVSGYSASLRVSSTADASIHSSLLASVSMLVSATGNVQAKSSLHSAREAHYLERPKIAALQRESDAILLDKPQSISPFAWPNSAESHASLSSSAAEFQEQYVDILPKPWTAVSLSLNEDCSELHVVRYRSGLSPFMLRLPFSGNSHDDDDQELFDYGVGKAELQDIIQLSNYSCHNTGSIEAKGAKSNWWSERESLDKRLHELLINIENIWFGGFKGVFSQSPRSTELLARFRKSMDDIFTRHLPSRQALKSRTKPLSLDDKVLELFIGLGSDQDGVIDLDEPLADLLYFVVDMLQFNGERNAYDEIDFDGMTVDVLDALRSYHEALPAHNDQHLILVLDKRLQAFPWESLPCLEGASVSRVGSLLSLRQRILAMRKQVGNETGTADCHTISRASGLYILNPSKDLASTEATLSGPLATLTEGDGAEWTAMVQQEPSEDEFRTALTWKSMVLYFGHGSGAQYIRPRTIRKLDWCSEVVWLMGCSSGAVTEHGDLEPSAVPLAYLMAGKKECGEQDGTTPDGVDAEVNEHGTDTQGTRCMAVVATLWDVTDKDIDRFSLAVGEEWGLWPSSEASKLPTRTPRKPNGLVAPSTPQQFPKTPKTPKTRKTPAKTPARSRSRPVKECARKKSLVEAVSKSRDTCYLRYLNGAAPVVYGVPVYLGD